MLRPYQTQTTSDHLPITAKLGHEKVWNRNVLIVLMSTRLLSGDDPFSSAVHFVRVVDQSL